jgi:hypothetical protein
MPYVKIFPLFKKNEDVLRINYRFFLGILIFSALTISFISKRITPAEIPPDERSHYSLTCFMINHPQSFPIPYDQVKNFGGNRNHTIHPPLYYYSLATVARLLNSKSDLSKMCALKQNKKHRAFNLEFNRKLRNYSFVFTVFGYLGIFRLLDYLCKKNVLSPVHTVLAAALSLFVPMHLYIVGMINNDVSVFFLWPYLTFYSTRFFLEGQLKDFLVAIIFFMLSLISKATFWFFGPGFMILGLIKFYAIKKENKLKENFNAHFIRNSISVFLIIVTFAIVALQLGYNIRQYGTPQPKYWQVYPGMTQEDSIFYKIPPEGMPQLSIRQIVAMSSSVILKQTLGITHHGKGVYQEHTNFMGLIFITAIFTLLLGTALMSRFTINKKTVLTFFYLGIPLIFYGIFMVYCNYDYYQQGYAGKSGRYFMGYLQLFLIGLMILASIKPKTKNRIFLHFGRSLQWCSTLALLFIFCHPLLYLMAEK